MWVLYYYRQDDPFGCGPEGLFHTKEEAIFAAMTRTGAKVYRDKNGMVAWYHSGWFKSEPISFDELKGIIKENGGFDVRLPRNVDDWYANTRDRTFMIKEIEVETIDTNEDTISVNSDLIVQCVECDVELSSETGVVYDTENYVHVCEKCELERQTPRCEEVLLIENLEKSEEEDDPDISDDDGREHIDRLGRTLCSRHRIEGCWSCFDDEGTDEDSQEGCNDSGSSDDDGLVYTNRSGHRFCSRHCREWCICFDFRERNAIV